VNGAVAFIWHCSLHCTSRYATSWYLAVHQSDVRQESLDEIICHFFGEEHKQEAKKAANKIAQSLTDNNTKPGYVFFHWQILTMFLNYVPTTKIYQDNKSTILLAKNGRSSSSWHTWHLDMRYFFVMDKIKNGDVKIGLCTMHDMLGDFFTKPLQGSLYIHMWDKILICPSEQAQLCTGVCWENMKK